MRDMYDITVIHESDPGREDFYDGSLPLELALRLNPLGFFYQTEVAIAQAPGGQSYLLFLRRQNDFDGRTPWVVLRFLGDAVPGQPRIQTGAWSDYSALRFAGRALLGFKSDISGSDELLGKVEANGISIPYVMNSRAGDEVIVSPPPPLLPEAAMRGAACVECDNARILAASDRFFAFAPVGRTNDPSPVIAYVLDRQSGTWKSLRLPTPAANPKARIFGPWLAVQEEEQPTASAGTSDAADTADSVQAGRLMLVNLADGRSIAFETGDPDSEVLDVAADSVVYRVGDGILLAQIRGAQLTGTHLVARDRVAAYVHWAFWSAAKPGGH